MRDKWYGDNRDLVKWGVLLELSGQYRCSHILQVLYYRSNSWAGIKIDGVEIGLHHDVIRHFRDSRAVTRLCNDLTIEVISNEFRDRKSYLEMVCTKIRGNVRRLSIVFLDPDTGLEPAGKAGLEHVLCGELSEIWGCLKPGDALVFYQHKANRNSTEWISPKKQQFERALGVEPGSARIASAPKIANDVVFFYLRKP